MELEARSFDSADERTTVDHGLVDLVHLTSGKVGRTILEPGWSWAKHVKPIVKTEWCEEQHVFYIISGRIHVRMAGGEEKEIGPGEVTFIPPGHDGYVVGDEPVVTVDWSGVADYAKP